MTMSWVEDRLEILNLIASYSHAADGTDPAAYAGVFTEDGMFHGRVGMPDEIRIVGREALTRFHQAATARRGDRQNRHLQTNTMFVRQTETEALTRSYLLVMTSKGDEPPVPGLTSIYEDEIVKTAEGWRIKIKRALPDRQGELRAASAVKS